jgi:hypothetical protein
MNLSFLLTWFQKIKSNGQKKKIWFKLWHDSKTLGHTRPWIVPLGVTSQNPRKGGLNLIQIKKLLTYTI